MRILFITNLYPPYYIGGYEVACRDIAEGLRQRGHIIKVLTSTYGVDRPVINQHIARLLDNKLKLNTSQTIFEKGSALFFNQKNYRITRNFTEKFSPDIVSFWSINGISASTILAVEKKGIPKVFHLFDRGLSYLRKIGIKSLFNYIIFNRLQMNHLISSSSELKKDYANRGFKEDSVTVIPHGVDIDKFSFEKKEIKGNLKLLYVGQLWEAKGVHILLKAIGFLKKENIDVRLIVIGSGKPNYINFLRKSCEEMKIVDKVQFIKRMERKKLVRHYQENHVLVFPSIWREPFGIVLLESMATGTPGIASRQGGPLDIILDGETGYFFEPKNAKDLVNKIMILERDRKLISLLGKNARKSVEERFNIKSIVEETEAYYRKVIERRNKE